MKKRLIIKLGELNRTDNNIIEDCDKLMTVLEKHLGDKYEIIVVPGAGAYTSVSVE